MFNYLSGSNQRLDSLPYYTQQQLSSLVALSNSRIFAKIINSNNITRSAYLNSSEIFGRPIITEQLHTLNIVSSIY